MAKRKQRKVGFAQAVVRHDSRKPAWQRRSERALERRAQEAA